MNKLLNALSAFFVASATLLSATSVLAQDAKGDAKAGEAKIAMCIGCHGIAGYQASFPEIYKVPKISGQSASYIVAALNAYKKGDRRHPSMRGIAQTLNDQDMADMAAYYTQHGKTDAKLDAKASVEPSPEVQALITRDKENSCTKCHGANFSTPNDATVPKLAGQHAD
jgi:cytochrome c553